MSGLHALPVRRDDLAGLLTLPVYAEDEPSLAGVLGIGRGAAYALARAGLVPAVRVGRTIRVPVARLVAEVLGETSNLMADQSDSDNAAGQKRASDDAHAPTLRAITDRSSA